MKDATNNCLHYGGLRVAPGSRYRCPLCGEVLDLEGVRRWVREAEKARDEAYSSIEGERLLQELQQEVYRRRRMMYELRSASPAARPEMILVVYDGWDESYECRIFYKEPRSVGLVERVSVGASLDTILGLRADPDPAVRLASEKVEEFHLARQEFIERGVPAPGRRVFYTNEF
jgi:hypothetical protein